MQPRYESPGSTSFARTTLEVSNSRHTMEWALFSEVPQDTVRAVLTIARRRTFARGEIVFHRGDPGNALHLISGGRFAVRITTPLGDTATLGVRGRGDAFGELALVSEDHERSATVQALEAAETRSVLREDFERLRREHPGVDAILVAILAERVRRLSELLTEAYYLSADERVVRRLAELAELYDGSVPLPQEALAELAGTSRATVNRVLRDLERRGSVALGRARIEVEEIDRLRSKPI
jgi:CRP/FNR family transcriptional regulator, cyclic AMP receptor protein